MSNQLDTLIKMLKQISANNSAYAPEEAAQRVSTHIKRFWALSMKKSLIQHADDYQNDLGPVEKLVIKSLSDQYS